MSAHPQPRSVLVTGGARRLGALICRAFAKAGWQVWCHHHQSGDAAQALCAELTQQGQLAHPVQADLANEAQRRQLMQTLQARTGPLHCLVNNASLFEPDHGAALDMQAVRQQLEVNLLAPLSLASLMAQSLAQDTGPQISGARSVIHLLDQKVFNLNPDYFSYTVSKLALERSVALQAQALAPRLRVCGVAPGLLFPSGPQTQVNFNAANTVNLLRQATQPEQVAATCLFLADNPCITGVTVAVDNGQHLVPLLRDVMFAVDTPSQGESA